MTANRLSRRVLLSAGATAAVSASVAAPIAFGSPVALAIARHRAAAAAFDSAPRGEDLPIQLLDAEFEALEALVLTPCHSDAEFKDKLAYLLAYHRRVGGSFWATAIAPEVLRAIDLHIGTAA